MAEVVLKRNAADLLVGRMARDGEIERIGRGKYALPAQTANERQIGQKERSDQEAIEIAGQTGDLSNLSDLSENDLAPGERGGPMMSTPSSVLHDLEAIGATIEPAGDRLLLRAGPKPVPVSVIRRIREAKPELLALLHQEVTALPITPSSARVLPIGGEPGLEQPCAARRARVQMLDGAFLHFCIECGRFGAFGYGVRLRAGRLGRWYCGEHRPCGPQ